MSPRWIALAQATVLALPLVAHAAPLPEAWVADGAARDRGHGRSAALEASGEGAAGLGEPLVNLDRPAVHGSSDPSVFSGSGDWLDWLGLTDSVIEDGRDEPHAATATTYSYLSGTPAGIGDLAPLLRDHAGHPRHGPSAGAAPSGDVTYTVVESHGPRRLIGPVPAAITFGSAMCFLGLLGWVRQRRHHA